MNLNFTVPGRPIPLARHRTARAGHNYDPPENAAAKAVIQTYARLAMRDAKMQLSEPHTGPLAMDVTFFYKRPKHTRFAYPMFADSDNLLKMVCDALQGLVYVNDRQVIDPHPRRRWTDLGARTEITITSMEE
jgi:Holliday junction resolvase RusA-like endonuclease